MVNEGRDGDMSYLVGYIATRRPWQMEMAS
jgi:hypothetical protein